MSARIKLTLEYDGGGFRGWQRQDNAFSVQEALSTALARLTGQQPQLTVAGRTDAGVHARGQVVHCDLAPLRVAGGATTSGATTRGATTWTPHLLYRLQRGLNHYLRDHPLVVLEARCVAPDFDARRWACRRHYCYRILNRKGPPALDPARVWFVPRPLDIAAMAQAATLLLGRHDFSSFRAAHCQASSPLRSLESLHVEKLGEEICITASARSFLYRQMRIMTGTLLAVGLGRIAVPEMERILHACDRRRAGPTAPPQGLTLMAVDYPLAPASGDARFEPFSGIRS